MTFETCPTCGQRHPQGMVEHRTLEGEWCSPIKPKCEHKRVRVFDTCPAAYSCWDCGKALDSRSKT